MSIDDYDDITAQRVSRDIMWAINGDREAACRLMEVFESAVQNSEPVPSELLSYFSDCFHKIIEGTNPAVALHLGKPKHRPQDPEKWLRDVKLAIATEELLIGGRTLENAISEVAEKHNASSSTVRRAYLEYKY